MIGYTRGMICFACTTDFASFIVDNKLQIASNTCDALYGACSPVYGAYKDLIESMIAIIERFLKQYGLTLKIDWKAGTFEVVVVLLFRCVVLFLERALGRPLRIPTNKLTLNLSPQQTFAMVTART